MFKLSFRPYSVLVLSLILAVIFLPYGKSSAAEFTGRNVRIATSEPSAVSSYTFNFNIVTVDTLGSMLFEFCANDPLVGNPCTIPNGFDASGAVLSAQSGQTGFAKDPSSTINRLILTRAASLSSLVPVSYTFDGITNPNDHGTYYVRLTTYASLDATGPITDRGGVVFAMTRGLSVATFVPPYLTFCVGVTVSGDCSSANGNQLSFGELSTSQTKAVTSQFAGATNDPGGYSTYVNGLTMTSGTNTIPALEVPSFSQTGVSQFGMNLRSNTVPGFGADPSGIGTTNVMPDLNQPNRYVFKNQIVTDSDYTTDFNLFTATYIVNIAQGQRPGVYTTTLTYTAIAAF